VFGSRNRKSVKLIQATCTIGQSCQPKKKMTVGSKKSQLELPARNPPGRRECWLDATYAIDTPKGDGAGGHYCA
jgi:hypothetical protein